MEMAKRAAAKGFVKKTASQSHCKSIEPLPPHRQGRVVLFDEKIARQIISTLPLTMLL